MDTHNGFMLPLAALGILMSQTGTQKPPSRLKGLDAFEVFLVTTPPDFANDANAPSAKELREVVLHRLQADAIPLVSYLEAKDDPAKLAEYGKHLKGQVMVETQLVRSGDGYAFHITLQVVENATVVRTSSPIYAPIWSKSALGVGNADRLRPYIRNAIVSFVDDLAAEFKAVK